MPDRNKSLSLMAIAISLAGITGVVIAVGQSLNRVQFAQTPAQSIPSQPASEKRPKRLDERQAEVADQLANSTAGQLTSKLSEGVNSAVENSKTAIGQFIQQKLDEQRAQLQQTIVDALKTNAQKGVNSAIEAAFGEVDRNFAAEFEGIKLTSDQQAQIRQARQKMQQDAAKILQSNPDLALGQLQKADAKQLQDSLAVPLKTYVNSIATMLTPEQRQKWQQNFDSQRKG
jgi:cell shape-determining protein MreC